MGLRQLQLDGRNALTLGDTCDAGVVNFDQSWNPLPAGQEEPASGQKHDQGSEYPGRHKPPCSGL